jgi:hypothetical protein
MDTVRWMYMTQEEILQCVDQERELLINAEVRPDLIQATWYILPSCFPICLGIRLCSPLCYPGIKRSSHLTLRWPTMPSHHHGYGHYAVRIQMKRFTEFVDSWKLAIHHLIKYGESIDLM